MMERYTRDAMEHFDIAAFAFGYGFKLLCAILAKIFANRAKPLVDLITIAVKSWRQ